VSLYSPQVKYISCFGDHFFKGPTHTQYTRDTFVRGSVCFWSVGYTPTERERERHKEKVTLACFTEILTGPFINSIGFWSVVFHVRLGTVYVFGVRWLFVERGNFL